jgi:hypothetical protein
MLLASLLAMTGTIKEIGKVGCAQPFCHPMAVWAGCVAQHVTASALKLHHGML